MTNEQNKKQFFVEGKLYELLNAIDSNILDAGYQINNGEEYVIITYAFPLSERRINISGDSLSAIAMDVLRHI